MAAILGREGRQVNALACVGRFEINFLARVRGGRGLGFEAGVGVVGPPSPPEVNQVGHRLELLA